MKSKKYKSYLSLTMICVVAVYGCALTMQSCSKENEAQKVLTGQSELFNKAMPVKLMLGMMQTKGLRYDSSINERGFLTYTVLNPEALNQNFKSCSFSVRDNQIELFGFDLLANEGKALAERFAKMDGEVISSDNIWTRYRFSDYEIGVAHWPAGTYSFLVSRPWQ